MNNYGYIATMTRLKNATGNTRDRDLAVALNLSPTALSNRNKARSLPYDEIVKLCRKEKLSLDHVFTGQMGSISKRHADELRETIRQQQDLLRAAHFRTRSTPINQPMKETAA